MIIQGNDPYRKPSFTRWQRFRRQLWNIVQALLFRTSPRPFHAWRALLLRLFGARIGRGCHVYPGVDVWAPWNLQIGNYVGIADSVCLYSMDTIKIGDFAIISQGAYLCGGTHDLRSKNLQLICKPIVVGARAWICAEAFIHPGVDVPEGAVVGARAVVHKSLLKPWCIYSGNPVQEVRMRDNYFK